MSSLTVNYGFYLPAEGDGQTNGQTWAQQVNANFEEIDTLLKARQDSIEALGKARLQATSTTSPLAPGGTWTGTITVPKTCALVRVETSRPAVIRAYGSATARTADSTRPFTEPPGGGTGVQFQGTTVASLLEFVASATLSNDDDPAADLIYLHVENRDTSTGTITIIFTVIPMED